MGQWLASVHKEPANGEDSSIQLSTELPILRFYLLLINENDSLSIVYLVAIVTGMLIPYIRAKAESMSIECSGGIAERTERAIILLVGTGLHGLGLNYSLAVSAWVLAILGLITTCQRLLIVKRAI